MMRLGCASTRCTVCFQVSYVKYIDIWVTGCMCFLVTAMMEYAIVYSLWWRPIEQLYRQHEREEKIIPKQVFYRKRKMISVECVVYIGYTSCMLRIISRLNVYCFACSKSAMRIHVIYLPIFFGVALLALVIRLPRCQRRNLEGYGKNKQVSKHNKGEICALILG